MTELPPPASSSLGGPGENAVSVRSVGAVAQANDYSGNAGFYGPGQETGDDFAVTLKGYLRIALKRKWLIAGCTTAAVALGTLVTLLQTPLYTSTVRLQIERDAAKVVEGGNISPTEAGNAIEFLKTQYELLQSRTMAERVVSAKSLHTDEEFLRDEASLIQLVVGAVRGLFLSTPKEEGQPDLQERAVGRVVANVSVKPVPGSRLVDVSYTNPNPRRAEQIANAYGDAFVSSTLDRRFEANSYAKTFLEDQSKQLKIRLEQSEKVLLDFAQQEQIVAVNEKSSISENNLAAANVALGQLVSERIKNEQLWSQVDKADAFNLPQILTNSVIDGLRAKRNELNRDYEEKLETFKPGYPAMVQIKNKIGEIDRQLGLEVKAIRQSLKAAYDSSLNQESEMKQRIEQLRAEVLDLQKRTVQYNILKREVETNRSLYNGLLTRFKEVDIAGGVGTNNVFIVDRAIASKTPSSPRLGRSLLLSLVLGLGASLGLAYLLEILDDRVRTPDEVEEISGLSMLGIIPKLPSDDEYREAFNDPHSAMAEAYRSLATALQFSSERGLPRSLTVTSAGPGEGKSSTAIAISRHFANLGKRVLLVDADLRNPSLHKKLGHDNSYGLSNYLTGASAPPDVIQTTDYPNLALMASGPLPPNAADLLGGTRMFSLASIGLEVFDLIVIDSPPLLGLADAPLISSAVSATIFIVGAGQQPKAAIRSALRRLQLARGTVIGVVLTKFDSKAVGYGSGYGYGYGYGYGADAYSYGAKAANTEPDPQLSKPVAS